MLEEELKRWERFQDVLRIEDRPIFEEMMDLCRRHASEAGNLASPSKTEGMFLSILFAHHKALKELKDRLPNRQVARTFRLSNAEGGTNPSSDGRPCAR